MDLTQQPHRRYNPLTREWVLVSPQRTQRPWQGQMERVPPAAQPEHDPGCYLCPGNSRAGSARNPEYDSTFVFDNDFAALKPDTPAERQGQDTLLVAEGEPGVCRVVCFSPKHNLTLAAMPVPDIVKVVNVWADQCQELGRLPFVNYVQIFENRGEMMGASNPHPHCQIWTTSSIPNEVAHEQYSLAKYSHEKDACLLCDYLAAERAAGERIVVANEWFTVVVPFWAVWPFETLLLANQHVAGMDLLEPSAREGLADIIKRLTATLDNVFQVPFPYTMGFHQRPTDGGAHPEWHLHAHYLPPLLRSATVRKFMTGFELLAMPQRDITPEAAAVRLREAAHP